MIAKYSRERYASADLFYHVLGEFSFMQIALIGDWYSKVFTAAEQTELVEQFPHSRICEYLERFRNQIGAPNSITSTNLFDHQDGATMLNKVYERAVEIAARHPEHSSYFAMKSPRFRPFLVRPTFYEKSLTPGASALPFNLWSISTKKM
jgi:hypothetical protein